MPATESLLLVLRDEPRRTLYAEAFARAGYRVMKAPNAAEALTRCNREQPSIVITDVVVPGMHGIDIARALRACARPLSEPLIIGLVDRCFDAADTAAEAMLFDRLVSEPIEIDVLVRDVGEARGFRRGVRRRWVPRAARLHLA